ncbi:TonB-dependent hemoglobin/transferrin/lactoferrin family receptor [Shewanella violacea]|uniref:TonB-dependent heme/hemoglobin receptor n=1 Tax=Shewanella violacea (strain JCM 10179 / CIP 106290 / LMG 19151 / DSS12) TaxID=637905 RepID=D4ZLT6_SHEVD|nr:TonB-dependent hemoglobin/transferrin/lactoferrin family receptor [Shewanella violacea]BAJ02635.1 TonB-dependent heme/hemoglobin receptor [Shewanella violacea DSS12]
MKLLPISVAIITSIYSGLSHSEVKTSTGFEQKNSKIEVIKVIGTRLEKPLNEISGSAVVITAEDIENLVASELSDLFRNEPGVSVTGSAGTPQNITIRGITGNRILMIKDGVRMADGYGASDINDSVGRFNFDLDDVKSIQVAKGAASAFFGSGALGGVVKVETKEAADYLYHKDYYLALKGLYSGVSSQKKVSVTAAARAMDIPVMLRMSQWQGHEQQNYADTRSPADIDGTSISFNTNLISNKHWLLSVNSDWQSQTKETHGAPNSVPQPDGAWDVVQRNREEVQSSQVQQIKLQYTPESFVLFDNLSSQIYYGETKNSNQVNDFLTRTFLQVQQRYRQYESDETFKEEIYGFSVDMDLWVELYGMEHDFLYGIEGQRSLHSRAKDRIKIENGKQNYWSNQPFADASTESLSGYISDDISLSEHWGLLVSSRYDRNSLSPEQSEILNIPLVDNSSDNVSSSISLSYDPTVGVSGYLAYSQGYRAAPYDKVYGSIPHLFAFPPFEIIPNSDLHEETSESIELGMRWQWQNLDIAASYYYNQFDGFIDWIEVGLRQSDGVFERQFVNIDSASSWGGEFNLDYNVTENLDLLFQMGWVDGKNNDTGEKLRTLTPLEGSVSLNYQYDNLRLSGLVNGASEMTNVTSCVDPLTGAQDCPAPAAWVIVDLAAQYEVYAHFKVNLSIKNLLDKEYVRYQDVAGTSGYQPTQPGRSFSASVSYKF